MNEAVAGGLIGRGCGFVRRRRVTGRLPVPRCTEEGHVRTQKEGGHSQARMQSLTRHRAGQDLDLGLPASRTGRRLAFVFECPYLWTR